MTTIPLSNIDVHDRAFCISHPVYDETILSSIRQLGIVEPLLLLNSSPPVVVSGFKRLQAATDLGYRQVPAVTIDITEKEAVLIAIHSNIHRGLNIVEKANALERMLHFGFSREEVFGMMNLLSLGPHEKVLTALMNLANSEKLLKDFIYRHSVSLKNTGYLLRFDVTERKKIIQLLSGIHITEGSLRDVLELIGLMKVKKGRISFKKIQDAEDAVALRKRLKEETSPLLSSLEKKLKRVKEQASLPPGIDIKVDPFFEKEYIDILLKVKSEGDVKASIEKLKTILEDGYIRSILELTKG